ncbi:hypothetical protein DFH11DRAFT_1640766 [Phellopilus nigrolimitatus]|nr:hypothetical protein DFH11DRAFT_1640766 [Phellopilus nigrolimitatus]
MASNYKDITGRFVATAQVTAKPGKADEIAQWISNLKARADSDVEPGTLGYHIVRHGDRFAVWEEYADKAALEAYVYELQSNLKPFFLILVSA